MKNEKLDLKLENLLGELIESKPVKSLKPMKSLSGLKSLRPKNKLTYGVSIKASNSSQHSPDSKDETHPSN
jgi:hypothetical protein